MAIGRRRRAGRRRERCSVGHHRFRRTGRTAPVASAPGREALVPASTQRGRRRSARACRRRRRATAARRLGSAARRRDVSDRRTILLRLAVLDAQAGHMKIDSRLRAAGLTFERGGRRILDSITVQFSSGSVTAVLGPNGAGKSTLLGCMVGLLRPSRGAVDLDETPLASLAADERARRIAFLPQIPEISWPVDVATLVTLGRIPFRHRASDAENEAAVRRAMQATRTTQWSQRTVTTLSGGERARVLLARVLAGESDWILTDEPFAGLDPAHQFEAADLLQSLAAQGHGVVLTIHDL